MTNRTLALTLANRVHINVFTFYQHIIVNLIKQISRSKSEKCIELIIHNALLERILVKNVFNCVTTDRIHYQKFFKLLVFIF